MIKKFDKNIFYVKNKDFHTIQIKVIFPFYDTLEDLAHTSLLSPLVSYMNNEFDTEEKFLKEKQRRYILGTGCSKNIDMAIKYFRNAAGTGHNKAANKLGDIYYYGEGTPKDAGKAHAFYLMAAENGDSYGMYSVAYMILNGEIYWVDKSVGKQWLKKAADLGNESAINLLKKIR